MDTEFVLSKVKGETLFVVVKPHALTTQILEWWEEKQAFKVAVSAVPDKNKANEELQRFFSKEFGICVEIISGKTSRLKKLRLIQKTI